MRSKKSLMGASGILNLTISENHSLSADIEYIIPYDAGNRNSPSEVLCSMCFWGKDNDVESDLL